MYINLYEILIPLTSESAGVGGGAGGGVRASRASQRKRSGRRKIG